MAWKIVKEGSSEALAALADSTVEQRPMQDEQNQLWELLPVAPQGDGQFKIGSVATGKVLAIPQNSTRQEMQVVQETTRAKNGGSTWWALGQ